MRCVALTYRIRADGAVDIYLDGVKASTSATWLGREWAIATPRGRFGVIYLDPFASTDEGTAAGGRLTAPMPGTVSRVFAEAGQVLERGDPVLAIEAMKMEHILRAPAKRPPGGLPVRQGGFRAGRHGPHCLRAGGGRAMTDRVPIVEVGPRDGLQNEPASVSVADKVSFIEHLIAAGCPSIEVGSFRVGCRRWPAPPRCSPPSAATRIATCRSWCRTLRASTPPGRLLEHAKGTNTMDTIKLDSCDGILTITFDRPGSLNAVDLEMARDMHCLAPRLRADHSTRVIVLRGAGNAFMAGGDIRQFAEHLDNIEPFIAEVIEGFHVFIRALADAPQPVVASIGGPAAGGGLSLALSADLAIAARGSKLAYAYRHLGTSPDGGGTYFLPRMVGAKRAAELLLLRDAIPAEEALALGLVNWVVEPDALENMTIEIARRLARNAHAANRATKALLRGSIGAGFADQLDRERASFLGCASQPDFREGVTAFLAKRQPAFGTDRRR